MRIVKQLKIAVRQGYQITRQDALNLSAQPLAELCAAADELRRHFRGNAFDICSIVNGKSGRCPENCSYCAQSVQHAAEIEEYPLLDGASILAAANHNHSQGILRFSIVTSGRDLADAELDLICQHYRTLRENCGISLCASHGLLSYEQLLRLKAAGVTRYHNNLETSRRYFPQVCTTHSYDDKLQTIKAAQAAGLTVCSGGILGLGETMEDRIDMALELSELGIRSIPVNVLNPIAGTPLAAIPRLTNEELCRTVAIFRFIIPAGAIRLAGGRGLLPDKGKAAFCSGANAAISGDMLTTAGISTREDLTLLESLHFNIKLL